MAAPKSWLLRLPEILIELEGLEIPVIDRAVFERIFGVRRRRAIQLMKYFDGYQSAHTCLVDRAALTARLAQLAASPEYVFEHRRRQRVEEAVDRLRKYRIAAAVRLPVRPGARERTMADLPAGLFFQPGVLRVEFASPEDLLGKLFELAKAAANDFETFCAAVEQAVITPGRAETAICPSRLEV
jgi:hypothetical protein